MPILLLDTATSASVFARIDKSAQKFFVNKPAIAGEDSIDRGIDTLFPDLKDLEEVWLGAGPGSFVGLRSSFAYIRMLTMLQNIPCRTFFSSELWHQIFHLPQDRWLLMRTNAKLFYAERFAPERRSLAVSVEEAVTLEGDVSYYIESWQPKIEKQDSQYPPQWQRVFFEPAAKNLEHLDCRKLHRSEQTLHSALEPLYGHELHFKRSTGKYG